MWFFGKDKKPKVFCDECKYMIIQGKVATCRNELNTKRTFDLDTPLRRGTGKVLTTEQQPCSKVNRDNDCVWFKPL